MAKIEKSKEEMSEEKRKVCKYWLNAIKRAYKQMPVDNWEVAEKRLKAAQDRANMTGDADVRPVVNDFRNHFEGSRAYLDQREPTFKVEPSQAYINDPDVIKQAKCERVYLQFVWGEQRCQEAQSQKLDSSLIRNVGYTMPVFDFKKWMPSIRYLPARDVRWDPDCGGLLVKATWCAYKEVVSLEMLKADNPELTEEEIKRLGNASVLDEKEVEETDDDEKKLYSVVTVWHIFAKNDSAVREYDDEEVKSLSDELKLNTQLRYIQIVEGLNRPLKDVPKWPFKLDHNENMITVMQMNKEPETLYGFTDYQQMEKMDALSDDVMTWIVLDAYYSSIRKFVAGDKSGLPSNSSLEDFMNTNKMTVLTDFLDEQGEPKIKEIKVGSVNQNLPGHYELMHDQSKEASGQNELASSNMADYKDVTAMGVRSYDEKLHQRINLRLSGPRGYEENIAEDAVKLLEIAHQLVPKYSSVEVVGEIPEKVGDEMVTEERKVVQVMPWADAKKAILAGGTLIKLGVDAIVGDELAQFWMTPENTPIEEIRLSTQVTLVPGSTRTITQEQKAADLQSFYDTTLYPTIYDPMGRFDLAAKFVEHIGMLKGIERMEDFLPNEEEISQFRQQQEQAQQAEQQAEQEQAQQEMAISQQQADNDQVAADADLEREGVKAEIEIGKELTKAELEAQKMELQLKQQSEKPKA